MLKKIKQAQVEEDYVIDSIADRGINRVIRAHIRYLISLFIFIQLVLAGCQDVPHTNPFDPSTAESLQAPTTLVGQLISPFESYEWTTVIIYLTSLEDDHQYQFSPVSDGRFTQNDLLVGLYQMRIVADGHLPYQQTLRLSYDPLILDPIYLISQQNTD